MRGFSQPKSNRLRYLYLKSNDRIGGLLPKEVLNMTDAKPFSLLTVGLRLRNSSEPCGH